MRVSLGRTGPDIFANKMSWRQARNKTARDVVSLSAASSLDFVPCSNAAA
jgi:hypothetical protein